MDIYNLSNYIYMLHVLHKEGASGLNQRVAGTTQEGGFPEILNQDWRASIYTKCHRTIPERTPSCETSAVNMADLDTKLCGSESGLVQ